MKKYFTKYLPVEGEIKIGDLAITKRGELFKADKVNNHPIYGDSLVKLFLCSRDIKVGDKFIVDKLGMHAVYIASYLYGKWIRGNEGSDFGKEICFKIIGEISPYALSYVKEGCEFSENEVHFEAWVHKRLLIEEDTWEQFSTHGWIEDNPGEYKVVCTIKGPCGHFH